MYEEFFNLKRKPFELVPDPDFIYLSQSHKRALTYLDYGVRERAGFILLTGDVGSGKTTLIRNLISKHYDSVVLGKVFNTRITSEQLFAMINDDFGIPVAGKDKVALIRDLNEFLLDQFASGNQPILVIDEAQNLAADLLEEVRLLSNLENSQRKLLQIVLVGQPELRATLAAPRLLQLRQRIGINCHLKPLNRQEVAEYVIHRLEVAGNASALEFPETSLDIIFKHSRGVPRLINTFCDFIMLAAYAEETKNASMELVNDVAHDLDFDNHFWAVSADDASADQQTALLVPESPPCVADPLPDLAGRLDALEKGTAEQLTLVRELAATLAVIRGEMSAQLASYEATANELRARLEGVSSELQYLELCRSENRSGAEGLARRFLDGITGSSGKK